MHKTIYQYSRPASPKNFVLKNGEIHVWRASLETSDFHNLLNTLTSDERERAERFYFKKDRENFIIARGALRTILSCYLDIEPSQIKFDYGQHGKPQIASMSCKEPLFFNLSHSHGLVLYAITRWGNIGIDVEFIRYDYPCEKIAKAFFSNSEYAIINALPTPIKHKTFFTYWTLKEAYIKAIGEGLMCPLDQIEILISPNEIAAKLKIKGNPLDESISWSLQKLTSNPGYVAALAVKGSGCFQIKYFNWPE